MPEVIIQVFKADIVDLQKKAKLSADRLEKLEKTGKKTTKELKKGFAGVEKGLTSFATKLAGAFAIQQLVASTIKIMASFEAQMDKVASITGATEAEMSKLRSSAKQLGATTAFTATQVGQLQEEYAKLGFSTKEILDATKATLDLAAATKSDLATAATVAGATVRGFSLDASETQRVVDVMAQAFRSSALDLSKFQVAMASVAPVAADSGVSIEETTALLGLLADRGLDASTAGTSLRNIFLTLSERGLTFNEAMGQINNSTDKSGKALELFGKRGAVAGSIIAQNADQVAELTKKLQDAQGVAEAMATQQLDNLAGKVTILGSAWEGFVLSLDDGNGSLSTFLKGAVDAATSLLGLFTATEKQSESLRDQQVELNVLVGRITDANIAEEDRLTLIDKLNAEFPEFLGNLEKEKVTNQELVDTLKDVNEQLINRIIIAKEQEKIDEVAVDTAEARVELAEAEQELREKIFTEAERLGKQQQIENKTLDEQVSILAGARKQRSALGSLLIKFNGLTKDLADSEESLNEVTRKREDLMIILGIEQEKSINQTKEEADAVDDLNKEEIQLVNTIKALRQEQSKLRTERDELEIGSEAFAEVDRRLTEVTNRLAIATGKETEEMKKNRKAREEAAKATEKAAKEAEKLAKKEEEEFKQRVENELKLQEEAIFRSQSLVDQENELFKERLKNAGISNKEGVKLSETNKKALEQLEKEHKKNLADIEKEAADKKKAIQDKEDEEQKERNAELLEAAIISANTLVNVFDDLAQQRLDKQLQDTDKAERAQLDSIQKQLDAEIISAEDAESAKVNIRESFETKRAEILTKQAKKDKKAALFRATIDGLAAVIKAGVATPLGIATAIANAIQIAVIAAKPIPEFHEGDVDIRPGKKNKKGEFQATLMERESVINPEGTARYSDELKAANNLTLDKLINQKYVVPAIRQAVNEIDKANSQGLAGNIAGNLNLMASLDPLDYMRMNKNNKANSRNNAASIINGISKSNRDLAREMQGDKRRSM